MGLGNADYEDCCNQSANVDLMKAKIALILASIALVLILSTNAQAVAYTHEGQYYGVSGGEVRGFVLGSNRVLDWAIIYAKGSQRTYEAFSGMSGAYQMRLPVGTYNVSANFPGYQSVSRMVNVTEGSSTSLDFHLNNSVSVAVSSGSYSVINFYLDETQVPVPEFGSGAFAVLVLTMLAMLILRRHHAARRP